MDGDFEPIVYVKTVDGVQRERTAYSRDDEVSLRFDGWKLQPGAEAVAAARAAARESTRPAEAVSQPAQPAQPAEPTEPSEPSETSEPTEQ